MATDNNTFNEDMESQETKYNSSTITNNNEVDVIGGVDEESANAFKLLIKTPSRAKTRDESNKYVKLSKDQKINEEQLQRMLKEKQNIDQTESKVFEVLDIIDYVEESAKSNKNLDLLMNLELLKSSEELIEKREKSLEAVKESEKLKDNLFSKEHMDGFLDTFNKQAVLKNVDNQTQLELFTYKIYQKQMQDYSQHITYLSNIMSDKYFNENVTKEDLLKQLDAIDNMFNTKVKNGNSKKDKDGEIIEELTNCTGNNYYSTKQVPYKEYELNEKNEIVEKINYVLDENVNKKLDSNKEPIIKKNPLISEWEDDMNRLRFSAKNDCFDSKLYKSIQSKIELKKELFESNFKNSKNLLEDVSKIEKLNGLTKDSYQSLIVDHYKMNPETKQRELKKINILDGIESLDENGQIELKKRLKSILLDNLENTAQIKNQWMNQTRKTLQEESQSKGKNFGDMSALDYISFYKLGIYGTETTLSLLSIGKMLKEHYKSNKIHDEVLDKFNIVHQQNNIAEQLEDQHKVLLPFIEKLNFKNYGEFKEKFEEWKIKPENIGKSEKDFITSITKENIEKTFGESGLNIKEEDVSIIVSSLEKINEENKKLEEMKNNVLFGTIKKDNTLLKNYLINKNDGAYDQRILESIIDPFNQYNNKLDEFKRLEKEVKEVDEKNKERIGLELQKLKEELDDLKVEMNGKFITNGENPLFFNIEDFENSKDNLKDNVYSTEFLKHYLKTNLKNDKPEIITDIYQRYIGLDNELNKDKINELKEKMKIKGFDVESFENSKDIENQKKDFIETLKNKEETIKKQEEKVNNLKENSVIYTINFFKKMDLDKIDNEINDLTLDGIKNSYKDLNEKLNGKDFKLIQNKINNKDISDVDLKLFFDQINELNSDLTQRKDKLKQYTNNNIKIKDNLLLLDNLYKQNPSLGNVNFIEKLNGDKVSLEQREKLSKYLKIDLNEDGKFNPTIEIMNQEDTTKKLKEIDERLNKANDVMSELNKSYSEVKKHIISVDKQNIDVNNENTNENEIVNNKSTFELNTNIEQIINKPENRMIGMKMSNINAQVPKLFNLNENVELEENNFENINKTNQQMNVEMGEVLKNHKDLIDYENDGFSQEQKDEKFIKSVESSFTNLSQSNVAGHLFLANLKHSLKDGKLTPKGIIDNFMHGGSVNYEEGLKNIIQTLIFNKQSFIDVINDMKKNGELLDSIKPEDLLGSGLTNSNTLKAYERSVEDLKNYMDKNGLNYDLIKIDELNENLGKIFEKNSSINKLNNGLSKFQENVINMELNNPNSIINKEASSLNNEQKTYILQKQLSYTEMQNKFYDAEKRVEKEKEKEKEKLNKNYLDKNNNQNKEEQNKENEFRSMDR